MENQAFLLIISLDRLVAIIYFRIFSIRGV